MYNDYIDLLKEKSIEKIHEETNGEYNSNEEKWMASRFMNNLPKELYKNVEEWINDKKISNIAYNGLSIRELMYYQRDKKNPRSFIDVAPIMSKYIKDGCPIKLKTKYLEETLKW